MNLLTRHSDYAIRALVYIAQHNDQLVTVAELHAQTALPRAFLRKILQELQKAEILCSVKGMGGGFRLARAAGKIALIDVVEVFQGPLNIVECIFKKKVCRNKAGCSLRAELLKIESYAKQQFMKKTIDQLMK